MFRKRRSGGSGINAEGWMMSYADMATTLLAMFIVLSTLGKDQTGVSLYNGTGSVKHALDSFGLPGFFPDSARLVQPEEPTTQYLYELPPDPLARKPDPEDPQRLIDNEEDRLQKFLRDRESQFPGGSVAKLPRTVGQVIFDLYEPLRKRPPYLPDSGRQAEVFGQVGRQLEQADFRVYLIVWATTPSESAWTRAAEQAQSIADQIAHRYKLGASARSRLTAVGQPWRYRNIRRPVLSLVVARME
jgi:hypothetical protein